MVLVSFTILVRATVLPAHHHDHFPEHVDHPAHNHPAYPRAAREKVGGEPASNSSAAHANLTESIYNADLVAADGTRFNVDFAESRFVVSPSGEKQDLKIVGMYNERGSRDASIAFFMQISEANLLLLPRLLVVMWHPGNVYVLHLDTKIPEAKVESVTSAIRANPKFTNVHFLPQEPITYKGVSMLLNTLSAMEYLLKEHPHWDYFVNLSGSDYPLVNVGSMRSILGQENVLGKNISFVQLATDKSFWQKMKQSRFDFMFYDTSLGLKKEMNHELIHTWVPHPIINDVSVEFVQAEAWIVAHRTFAEYAARSSFSRRLLLLLSTMQDPEEHFFGMLAWNTPQFNRTLAHHAFRGIYWEFNGTMSGQHPYYVDKQQEDGTFPFYQSKILNSRCFFARKFKDPTSALLDTIDRSMSGTHLQADIPAVSKSLLHVRRFVSCIADVGQIKDRIRAYDSCWFPS